MAIIGCLRPSTRLLCSWRGRTGWISRFRLPSEAASKSRWLRRTGAAVFEKSPDGTSTRSPLDLRFAPLEVAAVVPLSVAARRSRATTASQTGSRAMLLALYGDTGDKSLSTTFPPRAEHNDEARQLRHRDVFTEGGPAEVPLLLRLRCFSGRRRPRSGSKRAKSSFSTPFMTGLEL